jgi:ATP/maltotriose-dependent transcriptional regulator MalT
MSEFQALEHLVVVHQQRGDWDGAWRHCGDLVALGEKLRGGSEAPFSRALWALTCLAQGHPAAAAPLDAAIEKLRAADAKHRLAYALTRAAALDLARGETAAARARAEEAMRAASALGRPTEAILAAVTLARVCLDQGDRETAARLVRELRDRPATGAAAVARAAVRELLQAAAP